MDLESFLTLEKRRLADERQCLYEQLNELNSSFANTSITQVNENCSPKNRNDNLSKKTKDWINEHYSRRTEDVETSTENNHKKKNLDDMEQWVSDTFYSYFPGFSNEYQKRQNELEKRQRENQENFIKHQMLNTDQKRNMKNLNMDSPNMDSAHSNNPSATSSGNTGASHGTNKTDMEIINVNNPNYVPLKYSNQTVRPDSARFRLLQDLRHTNLSNLINESPEDAREINRRQAEIESNRKKQYQRELMQQIEEKRLNIKLLRDKEHQQEELLTRRLQEQLKTMKLEEQLEKERIKAIKVRFDAEQNRLTRENLLAKLDNDTQLLLDPNLNKVCNDRSITSNNETNKENIANKQDNKVYRYFSNSEKNDYSYRNKSSSLPIKIDLEIDQSEMAKIERECFHLSEEICPSCDEPLKEFENFCLCCQNKIFIHLKSSSQDKNMTEQYNNTKSRSSEDYDKNPIAHKSERNKNFFLVCIRCKRLYSWCRGCMSKTDVCKACQNERNLCMSCRKTLCSFCLEEIACGKDTESLHINNNAASFENEDAQQNQSANELSFNIMQDNRESTSNDNKSSNTESSKHSFLNNLNALKCPYSINMEQNSIFHPDAKPMSSISPNEDKYLKSPRAHKLNTSFYDQEYLENSMNSNEENIERLRRDTDKMLSRYLKNYGDLAYQTRGTQTTPTGTGRRDIVLKGEHSLSIPLLREMPKMTRMETIKLKENSKDLENLQRRWDIPAVQKNSISSASPRVITQVGAMRKQLQVERIFSDDGDY